MTAKNVSAAEVRSYFADKPDRLPEGSSIGSRGRLAPEVVEAYRKFQRGKKVYAVGTKTDKTVTVTDSNGKQHTLPVTALRAATKAQRGRFSATTVDAVLAQK